MNISLRLGLHSTEEMLLGKRARWHRSCYQECTHAHYIKRENLMLLWPRHIYIVVSSLHRSTMCFVQSLMYELKTDQQVTYEPIKAKIHFKHCDATENDHVLGVGPKVHSLTCSRQLIDYLHELDIDPT